MGMLDEVEGIIRKYVVLDDPQYVAVTLWTAATHGIEMWEHATRLAILSPVKGCGKTTLMDVLAPLSYEALPVISATTAALYRTIAAGPRTIFHDEADTVFGPKAGPGAEDLRAFYNGGFSRDYPVIRMVGVGAQMRPVAFDTFAMAALASKTHDLPDTIQDRSVVIRMRKRTADEKVTDFRRRDIVQLRAIGKRLNAKVTAEQKRLTVIPPTNLTDRAADVWEPLFAIADVAGGDWPRRARDAAKLLTHAERQMGADDEGLRLLRDVRRVWPTDAIGATVDRAPTHDLLDALHRDHDSDWERYDYGKPITGLQLAKLLRPYKVQPKVIRFEDGPARGYRRDWFEEAWNRYVPRNGNRRPSNARPGGGV